MTIQFPAAVAQYLLAVQANDLPTSLEAFSEDAIVIDDGVTYTGREIAQWRMTAETQYNYTRSFRGLDVIDKSRYVAHYRLEGDFPGGVADLRFSFTLATDGSVRVLEIAP